MLQRISKEKLDSLGSKVHSVVEVNGGHYRCHRVIGTDHAQTVSRRQFPKPCLGADHLLALERGDDMPPY